MAHQVRTANVANARIDHSFSTFFHSDSCFRASGDDNTNKQHNNDNNRNKTNKKALLLRTTDDNDGEHLRPPARSTPPSDRRFITEQKHERAPARRIPPLVWNKKRNLSVSSLFCFRDSVISD